MKITLPTYHLKAAQQAAPKHDSRYYLNGIYLSPHNEVVATNGHTLLRISSNIYVEDGEIPPKGLILSLDGAIPKVNSDCIYTTTIEITQKQFIADVGYGVKKKQTKLIKGDVIEGTYPDYNRIVKDLPPINFHAAPHLVLATEYLNQISEVCDTLGINYPCINPAGTDTPQPICKIRDSYEQVTNFDYVVMPARVGKKTAIWNEICEAEQFNKQRKIA